MADCFKCSGCGDYKAMVEREEFEAVESYRCENISGFTKRNIQLCWTCQRKAGMDKRTWVVCSMCKQEININAPGHDCGGVWRHHSTVNNLRMIIGFRPVEGGEMKIRRSPFDIPSLEEEPFDEED